MTDGRNSANIRVPWLALVGDALLRDPGICADICDNAVLTVFKWLLGAMPARLVDRFDTDHPFVRKD